MSPTRAFRYIFIKNSERRSFFIKDAAAIPIARCSGMPSALRLLSAILICVFRWSFKLKSIYRCQLAQYTTRGLLCQLTNIVKPLLVELVVQVYLELQKLQYYQHFSFYYRDSFSVYKECHRHLTCHLNEICY